jgi:regulator of RNase E activity RraA
MKPDKQYINKTLELQSRWDKIGIANISDALYTLSDDKYGCQVFSSRIRPIRESQHLAGRAVTVRGSRAPLKRSELREKNERNWDYEVLESLKIMKSMVYPGSVVVLDGAGGDGTAKLGEFMGWLLHQQGCKGFVLDSPCRDSEGLADIPDFSVFCDGITSIDSDTYWHAQQFNQVIGFSGQLVNQVRVAPGDWIIGGADGVIVVPQEIEMDILEKAEFIEEGEKGMRADIKKGISWEDAFEKWHRK